MRASFFIAILVAVLASPAHAQRGIDAHTFVPTVDSAGYFTVERSDTNGTWAVDLKLTVDYASRPLSADFSAGANGQTRRLALLDWQLVSTVGVTLGLTGWLAAVLQAPVSAQSFSSAFGAPVDASTMNSVPTGFYAAEPHTNIPAPDAGPLDLRLGLKAHLGRVGPVGFAALATVTLPFGAESAFLGDAGVTFRPTLVGDLRLGRFTAAANVGAVVRQGVQVLDPGDVVAGVAQPRVLVASGDDVTWGLAAGWRFNRWVALAVELSGRSPLALPAHSPFDQTLDVLGGAQISATRGIAFFVGGGAGVLTRANHDDSFRIFGGIVWSASAARPVQHEAATVEEHDADHDGVPDGLDRCPDQAEDWDGFADDDGCPDPDNDGDGILDRDDACPNEAEDRDGFEDSDGCPDLDNDGDGVADAEDACPNEPGDRRHDGCPQLGDAGGHGPMSSETLALPLLSYASGHSQLDRSQESVLTRVADALLARSSIRRIRIEGHADADESRHPMALSQARADAVRRFLIARGVDAIRLQAVGYGSTRPIDSAQTNEGRARNRRVELVVVDQ